MEISKSFIGIRTLGSSSQGSGHTFKLIYLFFIIYVSAPASTASLSAGEKSWPFLANAFTVVKSATADRKSLKQQTVNASIVWSVLEVGA